MATSTSTRDRLMEATGLSAAWIDSLLRILRQEGLLPTGGRGGGKSAVHYDSSQFAIIMLALAAPRLAEIADVVRLLSGLRFQQETPPGLVSRGLPTLQDFIANAIENAAVARRLGKSWSDDSIRRLSAWEINICLEVEVAFIKDDERVDEQVITVYATGAASYPALRRHTILTGSVLLAFGELWADTQLERERQELRNSSAKAISSNENADTSPKVPAPVTNQSPAKGTDALNSSDTTGGFAPGEVSRGDGTGHGSEDEPDLFDPARSVRCLTPT